MAGKRAGSVVRAGSATTSKSKKKSYVDPVVADLALSLQFQRVGGNMSPGQVSAILQAADAGRPARLVDLFHEARQKSGHVQSIFQTRELAVSGLPFDIAAPDGKKKRDKKYRDQCHRALSRCDTFRDMISHLVGEGNAFGFAFSEIVWAKNKDGLMVPSLFKQIGCRRFGFRQVDGKLLFDPTQNGAGNNVDAYGEDLLADYPIGKFVGWLPRVNGDVIAREGLCRLIVWMELFRTFDIRDWLQLAELAWKPWRLGKYEKNATKDDRDALRRIMQALTTNGMATHPDTTSIELQWPQQASAGKTSAHKELADFLADEESKAVLGQTDSVTPGPNGSRSATQVRDGLREDRLIADAAGSAVAIQKYVVEPFYSMNYGPSIEPGTYVPLTEDPTDILAFSQSMAFLRKAGLRIPSSYVYDKTGMPEPTDADECLGDGEEEPDPNAPEADPNGNNQDGGTEEDNEPEPKPAKPKGKPKSSGRRAQASPP